MSATSRADLHRLIDSLADSDVVTAGRVLEALVRLGQVRPEAEVANDRMIDTERTQAARARAVVEAAPIASIDELRGDFWPADEDAEEFDATVRRWRNMDRHGRLPT